LTKKRILTLVLIAIVPLLIGASLAGFSIWHDSSYYVKSITARVSGSVVQVSAPGSGEVTDLPFDVGAAVEQGQTVATLDMTIPQVVGQAAVGDSVRAPIKAPLSGTVIKRYVHVGERAAAGAPILSLVDLAKLYVIANVDESKVPLIQVGQPATIYLRAFDKNIGGEVGGLTPATSDLVTTATGAQPASGTPQVPVLIAFTTDPGLPIYPGMSAEVSIRVQ
jgi:multidrug resistance efflux pump